MAARAEHDGDGEVVRAGDKIAWSFGIPPQRVEGILFEERGKLLVTVTAPLDVQPKQASLDDLRKWVGAFWKVRGYRCPATEFMRKLGAEE